MNFTDVKKTRAVIDLDAVAHNYRLAKEVCENKRICAIIKADAYGHGAAPVAKCLEKEGCDFFATAEIAPYLLQNFTSAGRTKLRLTAVPLGDAAIPEPVIKEIRDTLASMRLDSVISSGFRISRSLAAQYITAGKASIDGLPCEKPDKLVTQGAKISLRGMGKIKLDTVGGQTKKGRISVVIHKYV